MSQPPGPANPYGDPPQQSQDGPPPQPYGQSFPQQSSYPQSGAYPGHPGEQPGHPNAYGQPQGNLPPGMPPLASWGARLGALLLDSLMFMLVPTGLIIAGYAQFISKFIDAQNACDDAGVSTDNCPTPDIPGSSLTLMAIGGALSLAATLFLCYREGKTGQTPGKKIVGIRLLREYDGAPLGFGLAFGRRLLHTLDALPCYLGFLWPLWDDKNQTFADKLVHTVTIRDQS